MDKIDPQTRVQIYTLALEELQRLPRGSQGLCMIVRRMARRTVADSLFEGHFQLVDSDLELLPEFQSYGGDTGGYWWPLYDKESRVACLKWCIDHASAQL